MQRWVCAGLLVMVSVAVSSGLSPWIDAIGGAFIPADIAQDAAAVRLFVDRENPYNAVVRDLHAKLIQLPVEATFPHFPHPPFSLIVSLPLAFTSFELGAALWFGFTLALICLLAMLLEACVTPRGAGGRTAWPWFFALLLLWPPVLYNLEKGQWSILLAVLLALATVRIRRGDLYQSAVWSGVAAAVKVFPIVLGMYFLVRSTRTALWFAATGFVLTLLPLLWIGLEYFPAFVRETTANMPYWDSFPLVMFSIHGAISRLLVGGRWAEPLVYAPLTAKIVEGTLLVALTSAAVWMTWLARQRRIDETLAFASWLVLLPMVNPQSLGHNGVLLAIPLVVLAETLTDAGRAWHRWAWVVSLALVSIPKQTVWRLATPPVSPLEGIAVASLPTWGALLMFLVTVALARDSAGRKSTGDVATV